MNHKQPTSTAVKTAEEKWEFENLINRLEICSLINHPNRPWSEQGKKAIHDAWDGNERLLKLRVEKLEQEIKDKI